jgi:sirohydrochlorin cobaltochelatase
MRDITEALRRWMADGRRRIGQIEITISGVGYELRPIEDSRRGDLTLHEGPAAARHISQLDEAGALRPLKTAPNLRRGWRLLVGNTGELRHALDYFYPAMLGVLLSYERGELASVPLRETLGRQTGMYRITQKLTDEQARTMIDSFCAGCLKRRLWDGQSPLDEPGAFPLLCHEACNLLVAEARKVVKERQAAS